MAAAAKVRTADVVEVTAEGATVEGATAERATAEEATAEEEAAAAEEESVFAAVSVIVEEAAISAAVATGAVGVRGAEAAAAQDSIWVTSAGKSWCRRVVERSVAQSKSGQRAARAWSKSSREGGDAQRQARRVAGSASERRRI